MKLNTPDLFDGPTFDSVLDGERLSAQYDNVKALMLDGEWRTLVEISLLTDYPTPSISARLRDMRKPRFGAYTVERKRRGNGRAGLFEYRVLIIQ